MYTKPKTAREKVLAVSMSYDEYQEPQKQKNTLKTKKAEQRKQLAREKRDVLSR